MKHMPQQSTTVTTRSGFTLLELLAVITIISILLALIMPIFSGILGRGDNVAVSAEMTQLDQALAASKAKFGNFPPSRLSIPTSAGGWDAKSRAEIKSIWPQFNFGNCGGLPGGFPANKLDLSGAECLVFFLGGVESGTTAAPVLGGFSKNPLRPWSQSENVDGPFMEFDLSRMTDVDGDDLYEYLDAIPDQDVPILYVSASGGRYNKDNDAGVVDDYDVFGSARDMSELYTQADGKTPHRKDSYQLISAGADSEYGIGGKFTPGESLPSSRKNEVDNITNFSGGTLN